MSAPAESQSLARGAASITVATALSRLTGFLRVVAVAAAMGTTFLANTYQTANTAPNVIFELVAAGTLTSVFVPTFVQFIVRGERDRGWETANVLTTVALGALTVLSLAVALAAPWIMRLLTIGVEDDALRAAEIELGADLLRLFSPQILLYGLGMIMTGAMHAHRRFFLPAIAPIFNNLVVIVVYLAYALMRGSRPPGVEGVTGGETLLLGIGTTLGVAAMTLCLVPQLRQLGWRWRWDFRPRHEAVGRAARLGAWALGYAGGYQAGLVVVLLLANEVGGGVAAYQWAYTFFYVPHALFGAAIFHVLFPVMSEHATRGEGEAFVGRLRDGLGMLAFLLLPVAAFLVAVAGPLAQVTLKYGVMSGAGAALVGRVLAAFAIGLPTFSAFLVLTRAFYALGDTKTPALVNLVGVVVASISGALLFAALPGRWSVAGLALGHSLGFAIAALVLAARLGRRVGRILDGGVARSVARTLIASALALLAMIGLRAWLPEATRLDHLVALVAATVAGVAVFVVAVRALRAPELGRIRSLLGRDAT